jgi:hypothetical protein
MEDGRASHGLACNPSFSEMAHSTASLFGFAMIRIDVFSRRIVGWRAPQHSFREDENIRIDGTDGHCGASCAEYARFCAGSI